MKLKSIQSNISKVELRLFQSGLLTKYFEVLRISEAEDQIPELKFDFQGQN